MTNLERIQKMTVEEMARFNVRYMAADDEMPYYETSDGEVFEYDEEEQAIKYEINWLNSECEVSE